MGFIHTEELWALVENMPKLTDLHLVDYDALVVVGGQGPMVTFRDHAGLKQAIKTFDESKRLTRGALPRRGRADGCTAL